MLWLILMLLLVLWAIGLVTEVMGGLIQLLLVAALIVFIVSLLRGRRMV